MLPFSYHCCLGPQGTERSSAEIPLGIQSRALKMASHHLKKSQVVNDIRHSQRCCLPASNSFSGKHLLQQHMADSGHSACITHQQVQKNRNLKSAAFSNEEKERENKLESSRGMKIFMTCLH